MFRSNQSTKGFTLIELMTATGLTVVMLLLMAALYSQTADVIRAGIATSDNIERARSATAEMLEVFDYMVPPSFINSAGHISGFDTRGNTVGHSELDATVSGGGVLVITQKMWSAKVLYGITNSELNDAPLGIKDPLGWYPQSLSKQYGLIPDDLRSDSVAFFAFNQQPNENGRILRLHSLTPSDDDDFTGNSEAEKWATIAKVWLGHTKLVNPDGSPKIARNTGTGPKWQVLDANNPVLDSFGNNTSNEWMLGLQYLLTGIATGGDYAKGGNHYQAIIDNDDDTNVLKGYSNTDTDKIETNQEGVHSALSDIASYSFKNINYARVSSAGGFDGLVGTIIGNAAPSDAHLSLLQPDGSVIPPYVDRDTTSEAKYTDDNDWSNPDSYKANAIGLAYANRRLYFNPAPSSDLFAWEVAQTHPGFLPYCNEIIIEFAADADGDGLLDREGSTDLDLTSGPDTKVDINWNGIEDDGSIIWYGAYQSIDSDGRKLGPCMRPNWNTSIYDQIPDFRRSVQGKHPMNSMDYAFVWRHDYPNNWPWLLRVRIRMMNRSGVLGFNPREPQFDYKKRRLKKLSLDIWGDPVSDHDDNYLPSSELGTPPPEDYLSKVPDYHSQYDRNVISFMNSDDEIIDTLPGVWLEYIIPVRRK